MQQAQGVGVFPAEAQVDGAVDGLRLGQDGNYCRIFWVVFPHSVLGQHHIHGGDVETEQSSLQIGLANLLDHLEELDFFVSCLIFI